MVVSSRHSSGRGELTCRDNLLDHPSMAWDRFGDNVLWVDHEYFAILLKFRRYSQFASIRTSGHSGPILVSIPPFEFGILSMPSKDPYISLLIVSGYIRLPRDASDIWSRRLHQTCQYNPGLLA